MFAQLKAILGTITSVVSIFKQVSAMYEAYKIRQIEKHYEEKQRVLAQTRAAIEAEQTKPVEEQNDEELRNLQRRLSNMGG